MQQVQYRIPGFLSPLAQSLLEELGDAGSFFEQPLKQFESACVVSTFEESLLVFPFKIEDELKPKLKRLHAYVRRVSIGQVAEELLHKASTDKKDSLEAARLLIDIINSEGEVNKEKLIYNFKVVEQ